MSLASLIGLIILVYDLQLHLRSQQTRTWLCASGCNKTDLINKSLHTAKYILLHTQRANKAAGTLVGRYYAVLVSAVIGPPRATLVSLVSVMLTDGNDRRVIAHIERIARSCAASKHC